MCQYTDRCPTTKHRPGTRCPVIVRQENQRRKLVGSLIAVLIMAAVFAAVYFYFFVIN